MELLISTLGGDSDTFNGAHTREEKFNGRITILLLIFVLTDD